MQLSRSPAGRASSSAPRPALKPAATRTSSPTVRAFRALCAEHGIAVTHQRQVLYEVMRSMDGHPSPEEVYARVRRRIPAVSLATVYKNIHVFVESGIFREVSLHHGSVRVEMTGDPHHHLVCSKCKAIVDIDEKDLGFTARPKRLPGGFLIQRFAVDGIGLCSRCQ